MRCYARDKGGRIDGSAWSQHAVEVLYVDRIVEHPSKTQQRSREARVGESFPCCGVP